MRLYPHISTISQQFPSSNKGTKQSNVSTTQTETLSKTYISQTISPVHRNLQLKLNSKKLPLKLLSQHNQHSNYKVVQQKR